MFRKRSRYGAHQPHPEACPWMPTRHHLHQSCRRFRFKKSRQQHSQPKRLAHLQNYRRQIQHSVFRPSKLHLKSCRHVMQLSTSPHPPKAVIRQNHFPSMITDCRKQSWQNFPSCPKTCRVIQICRRTRPFFDCRLTFKQRFLPSKKSQWKLFHMLSSSTYLWSFRRE